jgi:hypothetical protein
MSSGILLLERTCPRGERLLHICKRQRIIKVNVELGQKRIPIDNWLVAFFREVFVKAFNKTNALEN